MSQSHPLVSIGLPVYNGSKYIKEAIESILAQTFEDFELVIVDNCSTDDTYQICQSYRSDSRVRVLRNEKNLGAARNANRCVDEARGTYFKWAHYDDLIAPTFLERCVEILESDPEVVLAFASGEYHLTQDGQKVRHKNWKDYRLEATDPSVRFEKFLRQCYPQIGSFEYHFGVLRTEALRRTPLMQGYASADITLFGELALRGKWKRVEEPLFFYRHHDAQSHHMEDKMLWWDPRNEAKFQLVCWRWTRDYLTAIRRVEMSLAERTRCLWVLNRRFVRHVWAALLLEPLSYVKYLLQKGTYWAWSWSRSTAVKETKSKQRASSVR
jgi:glycosyltransferase involved in cell wall biosynthesis